MLPDVGSKIVSPGFNDPSLSAASIIESAARSLTEPVGLRSSILAHNRTFGDGDNFGKPINGVWPTESASESKRAIRS